MEKKAIIHISDLHVSNHLNTELRETNISWINTSNDDSVKSFVKDFIEYIKRKFADFDLYLIISGDIANASKKNEYDLFIEKLNYILSELSITKEKLLIIPGNHDVNRNECQTAFENHNRTSTVKPAHEFIEEKHKYYSEFHKTIKETDFPVNDIIVDKIDIPEEKLLILGLNSNYKVGCEEKSPGYINIEKLESEIVLVKEKYNDYSILTVFHHNYQSYYEENDGGFEKQNRISLDDVFSRNNLNILMFGHEHTPAADSKTNNFHDFKFLSCGSFSKKNAPVAFDVFEIVKSKSNKLELNRKHIRLNQEGNKNIHGYGQWVEQNAEDLLDLSTIIVREPQKGFEVKIENILSQNYQQSNKEIDNTILKQDLFGDYPYKDFNNNDYHKKIFSRVKVLKIFHSGHFHWSDNSKAHNWIEVAKLLNDKEDVLLCKKAILDVVKKSKIEFDFIIGLGIEGNILATRTAMEFNKPNSFLPYSYRYEDHADYEQKLSVKNTGFKKILIITDVVHDGNTIRKLINEKEPDFFKEVEEINVVSLFYSGKEEYSLDLINMTNEKKENEKAKGNTKYEYQPLEERIKFYFVSKMVVETCPYGADFRESCMIVKHKLDCVHEFYDAKKI